MAIEFDCPHCQHHYRLKDELAGKTATCKSCRRKIVIPVTVPDDVELDAEAAEAAALAALNDEPAQAERNAASQLIPVECPHCSHKWTEPLARAGKNALCPNPECKQRVKIPEPKDEGQYDWRQTRSKAPSLAKENFEKPADVQDAADVKNLSHETIKEKILEDDTEPRPLKDKLLLAMLALVLVAGAVLGARYAMRSTTERGEDRLMQEAQEEFATGTGKYDSEPALFTAVMHIAGGEHAVRHNTDAKLKAALDQFAKAREALRPINTPARNAVCADLAVALLTLGGTDDQIRDQVRIRWVADPKAKYRPNERVFTVFDELRTTLNLVQGADPNFRATLARRLTRELIKQKQEALALELIPLALFSPAELSEAKAIVALELYRVDRGSVAARGVADYLKERPADALLNAPSAQILFSALKTENAPLLFSPPSPGGGAITDNVRYAYTGIWLLEGKTDEALKLAQRVSSSPDAQLRALTLCAEWSLDPGPALDAAAGLISATQTRKEGKPAPYFALGLAQVAAVAGKHEQAKLLGQMIDDDGLKAWALGDAVRLRLASAPKEKAEDSWLELPEYPKPLRAGHAWGRMWIARGKTRTSGDRGGELKAVGEWPSPLVPFGKAGVALGLQDK